MKRRKQWAVAGATLVIMGIVTGCAPIGMPKGSAQATNHTSPSTSQPNNAGTNGMGSNRSGVQSSTVPSFVIDKGSGQFTVYNWVTANSVSISCKIPNINS